MVREVKILPLVVAHALRLTVERGQGRSHFTRFGATGLAALLWGWWVAASVAAQVSDISPRSCQPGTTTQLTLVGQNLSEGLRLICSQPEAEIEVESVTAEQALISLTLPASAPLGPLGLWMATSTAGGGPWIVMVDDLPGVIADPTCHSLATAQRVPAQVAVSGISRGAQSDFYRFQVEAGQRVAFQVLTQSLHSAMDPVLRLLTVEGQLLREVDDDGVGPEARFSYRFEQAGDYLLEVRDSQYARGGRYHLRVGDFPLLGCALPPAIQYGQAAEIQFLSLDGNPPLPSRIEPFQESSDDPQLLLIASRLPEGRSSAWAPVVVAPHSIHAAGEVGTRVLTAPLAFGGNLSQPGQRDRFYPRNSQSKPEVQLTNPQSRLRDRAADAAT